MNTEPLVSLIVPVFNAAQSIVRCLNSLSAQTYRNLEIIIINDGSTDNSLEVMDTCVKKLSDEDGFKVKLLQHEMNRGVAAARNTGLNNATGEYIYYVDADDWIEPETLKILVQKAEEHGYDIVGHELWMKYDRERYLKMPDVADGKDAFKKMVSGRIRWNLWLYLVKRQLYEKNNIRFLDEMNMGEDMMVMGKLFLYSKNMAIVHKPLYHYVAYNPASLTKNMSNLQLGQIAANINELENFVRQRKLREYLRYIQYLKLQAKIPLLFSNDTSDFKRWREWFPESNDYAIENKMSPLRSRILQYLAANQYFTMLRIHNWLTNSVIKIFFH